MARVLTRPKQPFRKQFRIGSAARVVLASKKYLESGALEYPPWGGFMAGACTVRIKVGGAVALLIAAGAVYAEMYTVNVRRIDKDLYKTSEGVYIQTKYCYEYTYGDDAVLKYEPYGYDNKLIFDSGEVCDVEKVFK